MGVDPAQNIFEIFVGINFVRFTGSDQTHENGSGFAATFTTHKKKILPSESYRADRSRKEELPVRR